MKEFLLLRDMEDAVAAVDDVIRFLFVVHGEDVADFELKLQERLAKL